MVLRKDLKGRGLHYPTGASLTLFIKENWKGLLMGGGALLFIVAWIALPPLFTNRLHIRDCNLLVTKGEGGTGTIVACNFIANNRPGDGAITPPYLVATIEYQTRGGGREKVEEYWPLFAGDLCKEGSPVKVYYLETNKFVKLASVNSQELRRASKTLSTKK